MTLITIHISVLCSIVLCVFLDYSYRLFLSLAVLAMDMALVDDVLSQISYLSAMGLGARQVVLIALTLTPAAVCACSSATG